MRIATKITLGYGTLIVLLVAIVVYHVSLIHRVGRISTNLSQINFRAETISLRMLRELDQLEEYTDKFFVSRDPGYAAKLAEVRDVFDNDLHELITLGRSAEERAESNRIAQLWEEYKSEDLRRESAVGPRLPAEELERSRSSLTIQLGYLQTRTQRIFGLTRQAIQSQVEQAAGAGLQAERVSWGAALSALGLSLVVSLLIVRSIVKSLDHLTEGTRAIAEGNFSYQLDDSRDDEFAQLAEDFNTMARRLEELDQMKKDFVSHVSHELRAPLASIQETNQLLLEQIPGPLTEKQRRMLELNLQNAKRLASMIGNLLDLSRLEAGVMDYSLEKHDLIPLIRDLVAEFETRTQEKNLSLEAELPSRALMVECDAHRIAQVIRNLLDNALKFSPASTTIRLIAQIEMEPPNHIPEYLKERILSLADGKGFVLVAVSDGGPGVPDPHKERIFQKFHQVKGRRHRNAQGVGLGLAIARTIVEAHQGAIWVEDLPEAGSKFNVLLPLEAAQEELAPRASAPL